MIHEERKGTTNRGVMLSLSLPSEKPDRAGEQAVKMRKDR